MTTTCLNPRHDFRTFKAPNPLMIKMTLAFTDRDKTLNDRKLRNDETLAPLPQPASEMGQIFWSDPQKPNSAKCLAFTVVATDPHSLLLPPRSRKRQTEKTHSRVLLSELSSCRVLSKRATAEGGRTIRQYDKGPLARCVERQRKTITHDQDVRGSSPHSDGETTIIIMLFFWWANSAPSSSSSVFSVFFFFFMKSWLELMVLMCSKDICLLQSSLLSRIPL